jgi:dTDP-4-amino-4,6-dideoxygalactose transaminase
MKTRIEFFRHNLTEEDIGLANQVMHSVFLTTGPMVTKFEKRLAEYLGLPEVVGLTSCTGAMHLALLRYGIGVGDEVVTTPMTFVATATAILQTGAVPIFVDVCRKSGLILPDMAETAITEKTKAILPVHLYGRMADMRGFSRLAEKHKLVLIEDSAHCIEGEREGVRPGQASHAACFSFYATKSMTCGEGGALACGSQDDASWYRSARHHGISKNASYRYTQKYEHWDMEIMGWKYNMDDIQAALLLQQIDRLNRHRNRRETLEQLYRERLKEIEGLEFMEPPHEGEISGHHLFTALVPKRVPRDKVIQGMEERGIGVAVNYRAIHTLKYFRETLGYHPGDFPNALEIGNRTISLPLYPTLTEEEVELVCDGFKDVLLTLS